MAEATQRSSWREGRGWPLFFAVWVLSGILWVGPVAIRHATAGMEVPWRFLAADLCSWYLWGLLIPPIAWWTRRHPWSRELWTHGRWLVWVLIHLSTAVLIAAAHAALTLGKDVFLLPAQVTPGGSQLVTQLRHGIEYYLGAYFLIVAGIHLLTAYKNDLVQANVEGQLVRAHLQNLKAQLRPHFLFNTLNAISSLMHRDVDAADRMIVRLSDLLRRSLDDDERHQVRLSGEIEFLECYLEIERIRFRDRLAITIDVAPGCNDAQVPRLILQPLVENAIVHGVAMRSAAGRIAIRAKRDGSRLRLEVQDDGPGLIMGGQPREGVGLSNTRRRLEQLFGDDYRFALENASTGGLRAVVELPFELQPRFPVTQEIAAP